MREVRLTLLISLISAAFGFVTHGHDGSPRGCLEPSNEVVSIHSNHRQNELFMVIKSSDIEERESDDEPLEGVSRFAVMGGMLRGGGSDNKDDKKKAKSGTKDEDDAGFFKNISRRLTFRRDADTINGVQASGEKKEKKTSGILKMIGIGREQKKDPAKQYALLQKDQELNRKRQKIISGQRKRDLAKEKEIKLEEQRIAKELAKLEASIQREEQKKIKAKQEAEKRKVQAALEAKRKRDEVQRQKEEKKQQKALAAAEAKETAGPNAATKFFSNVWNSTSAAFTRGEEQWVPLIKKTRIEPGEYIPVQVQGLDLLVVASRDGKVHCLANSCSHMGTPLETGRLESRPKEDANGKQILTKTNPPKVECEDCILCPLHHTAFSLETGEVRGEWCPYPPIIGPAMGKVKKTSPVAVFDIRTKGKWIEARINSPLE